MSSPPSYSPRRNAERITHDIDGIDHAFYCWGDASAPPRRTMLLLHGWGDSGATFQFVADEWPDDWRLIAPDWRGFGRSLDRARSYWFPDYLADLDAMVTRFSPDEPVNLLGHSMGGNIASLYAGVRPDRVATLVNVEGFGLPDTDPASSPDRYAQWLDALVDGPRYSDYAAFDELAARVRRASPRLAADRADFVARQWARRDDDGVIRLRSDAAHKLPNPILYRRAEARACWNRIVAPVLFVIGADTDLRHGRLAKVDAERPMDDLDVTVATIPGAAHMVHFEQPAALVRETLAFLSRPAAPR